MAEDCGAPGDWKVNSPAVIGHCYQPPHRRKKGTGSRRGDLPRGFFISSVLESRSLDSVAAIRLKRKQEEKACIFSPTVYRLETGFKSAPQSFGVRKDQRVLVDLALCEPGHPERNCLSRHGSQAICVACAAAHLPGAGLQVRGVVASPRPFREAVDSPGRSGEQHGALRCLSFIPGW
jgi:hypothetical protein